MKELNEKQKLFCAEYLKDFNATKAAIRAGYAKDAARQQGQRLLTKAVIQQEVAKGVKERSDKVKIDAEWVLYQAARVFHRCMQEEAVVDREGNPCGEYKFEHAGANKALDIIAKHVDVGAYRDQKMELSGIIGVSKIKREIVKKDA